MRISQTVLAVSLVLLGLHCIDLNCLTKKNTAPEPKSLAAKKLYELLINPPSKNAKKQQIQDQIKNLEMLGALTAEQAIVRILTTLERILGKNDDRYKNAQLNAKILRETLDELIPRDIPTNVYQASQWVNGNLEHYEETAEKRMGAEATYARQKNHTDQIIALFEKEGRKIPNQQLIHLLDDELETLDLRYKPIIKTLKSLGKDTILFGSVTLLDSLYKNALK